MTEAIKNNQSFIEGLTNSQKGVGELKIAGSQNQTRVTPGDFRSYSRPDLIKNLFVSYSLIVSYFLIVSYLDCFVFLIVTYSTRFSYPARSTHSHAKNTQEKKLP